MNLKKSDIRGHSLNAFTGVSFSDQIELEDFFDFYGLLRISDFYFPEQFFLNHLVGSIQDFGWSFPCHSNLLPSF
jgi:hypothetical protein